ncbi:MAG: hypothetical protein K0U37_06055 [Gammaproteobacteria bacterium]|nr:hypothetical protein [Gammaproteobacteria bacterium]
MKQHLKTALFCISTLLATPVLATNQPTLAFGPAVDYVLPSKEPQVFSNVFRWVINAECVIAQSDETSAISFKVLRKKASLNDVSFSRGETLQINVAPEETFRIRAEPGATVQLTNEGEETIVAQCYALTDLSVPKP